MSGPHSKDPIRAELSDLRREISSLKQQLRQIPSRFPVTASNEVTEAMFRGHYNASVSFGIGEDGGTDFYMASGWATEFFGSLGSFAGGIFTVPETGIYRVVFRTRFVAVTNTMNRQYTLRCYARLDKAGLPFLSPVNTEGSIDVRGDNTTTPLRSMPIILERTEEFTTGDTICPVLGLAKTSATAWTDPSITIDYDARLDGSTLEVHRLA